MKDIDTDGSGEITFDEFAVWFIGGREGTPQGMGGQIGSILSQSSAYNNVILSQLKKAVKEMINPLEKKDTRTLTIKINTKGGLDVAAKPGILIGGKFGITDGKDQYIMDVR